MIGYMKRQKTLKDLRATIARESHFVDLKPFSHNIIGLALAQIDKEFGRAEANKAINDFDLESLGWSSKHEDQS